MKVLHCFAYAFLMFVGCWQILSGQEQPRNDEFIQTFVDGVKDRSAVKFSEGQLKIWAKMSPDERARWVAGSIATAFPGLFFLGASFFIPEHNVRFAFATFGIAILLVGFFPVALFWAKRAAIEDSKFPCLMLDEEGITTPKAKKVLWQDVGNIALQSVDYFNGCGTKFDELRVLYFLDRYNNVMLQLDKSDMLSVSIDNVCALAQYYFKTYKEATKQNAAPVVQLAAQVR